MITNNSSQQISAKWSDNLKTFIVSVDTINNCDESELGLIHEGAQHFAYNVSSLTVIGNPCNPADCAIKNASITFFDTIS